MKKTFIAEILILVFVFMKGYSQDLINPPVLQNIDTCQRVNHGSLGFVKGWNWGSPGARIDSALNINFYHNIDYSSSDYIPNMNLVAPLRGKIVGGRNADVVFNALSLHLEPTLKVDTSDNFKGRTGDNTGAVFGFKYRNFSVGDTVSSWNDFGRFILHRDRPVTYPVKVLDSIWDGSILRWEDYDDKDHKYPTFNGSDTIWHWDYSIGRTNDSLHKIDDDNDVNVYYPFNGKQWYLTINLRALSRDSVENHLNDTILIIKLPYQLTRIDTTSKNDTLLPYTYSLVRFDSVPHQSYIQNYEIRGSINNHFRGISRQLRESPEKPTEFAITGEMLKVLNTDPDSNSTTLSAFAFFDGVLDTNELAPPKWTLS